MNLPIQQMPPQQPMQQQPMQQQPMQQQPMQQQPMQQQPMQQQAAVNQSWLETVNQPVRTGGARPKIPNGEYIIQFTQECKIDQSNKDFTPYMSIDYVVVDGTVPETIGQNFSTVIKWNNKLGQQNLAEACKAAWGHEYVVGLAQQGTLPNDLANMFLQNVLLAGQFSHVKVARSQKKVNEAIATGQDPMTEVFANHYWQSMNPQQIQLPSPTGPAVNGIQQPVTQQAMPPQQAPQQQMPPQQAPQQQMPPQQAPQQQMPPQQASGMPPGTLPAPPHGAPGMMPPSEPPF